MSRYGARMLYGVLLFAGLAYFWRPLVSWIEATTATYGFLAYGVAFVALVAVAVLVVRFLREQL
jgi:hypothetical protein